MVLVVGVNGTGKTTTIGKLAQQLPRRRASGAVLVAGDTFRAAAVEQLQIWGERVGAPVIAGGPECRCRRAGVRRADAGARREGADVLLIDTAGRLHNKAVLMDELRKIIRVLRKQDETAPHSVLLVLDATTGQNAVQQVRRVQGDGGRDRAGGDQARRQRARRDRGGAGGDVRAAGARGGVGERPAICGRSMRWISRAGWWGCDAAPYAGGRWAERAPLFPARRAA